MGFKIIFISSNIADIFSGEGWENWLRVKITKGKVKIFKGNIQMTDQQLMKDLEIAGVNL